MKKMNMYEAPKAEIIEMQTVAVLVDSVGSTVPPTPGEEETD
jgi:hypothetical protein